MIRKFPEKRFKIFISGRILKIIILYIKEYISSLSTSKYYFIPKSLFKTVTNVTSLSINRPRLRWHSNLWLFTMHCYHYYRHNILSLLQNTLCRMKYTSCINLPSNKNFFCTISQKSLIPQKSLRWSAELRVTIHERRRSAFLWGHVSPLETRSNRTEIRLANTEGAFKGRNQAGGQSLVLPILDGPRRIIAVKKYCWEQLVPLLPHRTHDVSSQN